LDDAALALDAVAAVTWLPEAVELPVVLIPVETVGVPVTEAAAEAGEEDGVPLPRSFKPAVTVTGVNPNMSPVSRDWVYVLDPPNTKSPNSTHTARVVPSLVHVAVTPLYTPVPLAMTQETVFGPSTKRNGVVGRTQKLDGRVGTHFISYVVAVASLCACQWKFSGRAFFGRRTEPATDA